MRSFNLEHAKAGAPVRLSDGTESIRIVCFDRGGAAGNIVALIKASTSKKEYIAEFNNDGTRFHNDAQEDAIHLVMRPLATVDGKEVYTGDELTDLSGASFIASADIPDAKYFGATWPAPYPVTRCSAAALYQVGKDSMDRIIGWEVDTIAVANAAIKHGIDNGYLFAAPPSMPSDDELVDIWRRLTLGMRNWDGITTAAHLRTIWNLNRT